MMPCLTAIVGAARRADSEAAKTNWFLGRFGRLTAVACFAGHRPEGPVTSANVCVRTQAPMGRAGAAIGVSDPKNGEVQSRTATSSKVHEEKVLHEMSLFGKVHHAQLDKSQSRNMVSNMFCWRVGTVPGTHVTTFFFCQEFNW